ncbi:MAG TPA: hypothetical protein VK666_18755 [Chryseolinea sp.]|nr:hypothetical protein [Chryseolinea sp.]
MSSHHFVKEGQEPALLILEAISDGQAQPFLEWSPLVVVSFDALAEVRLWGTKVDALIVATNKLSPETEQWIKEQDPLTILISDPLHSILFAALSHLVEQGERAVNVMCSCNDEHFKTAESFLAKIHIALFDSRFKWSNVPNGRFEKWVPAGTTFAIRKIDQSQSIHSQGLHDRASGLESDVHGFIQISSLLPFWVAEAF